MTLPRAFVQHSRGISSWFKASMARRSAIDASPPLFRGIQQLDKDVFQKSIKVLAAKVPPAKAGLILKAEEMRGTLVDLPKIKSVLPSSDGERLVILRFQEDADLPSRAKAFLEAQSAQMTTHTFHLTYDYWTADDILGAVLPLELVSEAPSGFATVGHIAHLNLNDEYLPYKYIIGQVILDKNVQIRTVVNKLNSIHNQFRFFQMELLAGEPNYIVEHSESNCKFIFDFSKVYWNSRLHTEHGRLVDKFHREDVIADVFAGVGPFALPAAKKGCAVLANDLNPESYKYLKLNIDNNKVSTLVRASCEDGRDFIRASILRVLDNPFPQAPELISKTQEQRRKRAIRKGEYQEHESGRAITQDIDEQLDTRRNRVTQFVMNLPDTAITFLGAFRGILTPANVGGRDLRGIYDETAMPMIHCYCFSRELEPERAEDDIRKRVAEQLEEAIGGQVSLFHVRSVAPNKEMYCISFRLPRSVAFAT